MDNEWSCKAWLPINNATWMDFWDKAIQQQHL